MFRLLSRIGMALQIAVEPSDIVTARDSAVDAAADPLYWLRASAEHAGIYVQEIPFSNVSDVIGFLEEGYPLLVVRPNGEFVLIDSIVGRKFESTTISEHVIPRTISKRKLKQILFDNEQNRLIVAKRELECDAFSADHHGSHSDHPQEHLSPVRRFLSLLDLERRDIWTVTLFAFVSGLLTLATPLAVESLVNVVSWGIYLQPLVVLGLILLICLGIAGVLRILQAVVVELIQRRQFVRIVSDLAHRFPRANQASLAGEYPRELANRVFDIMTIQKATAVLLLDGLSIVLTTILGLVLLAFYHPFLLGFDIVLLISMISITWLLGRGGIRTAIEESKTKYRVAHWLQDVLDSPSVFKTGGGESLAIQRANQLTTEYVQARQQQFRVVIRQVAFAISLQVIASTALLALGGWLVIDGQLTLGQLVASELVVTVVVGAFSKAGKSLEKFYDLMAGVDKVGHLIDIPTDPRQRHGDLPQGPAEVRWGDLTFEGPASSSKIPGATIPAGTSTAIVGDDVVGRSQLARTLGGLKQPNRGSVQIAGIAGSQAATDYQGRLVGYAGGHEIFHGTLRENVDLGRANLGSARVRQALNQVGLSEMLLHFPDGLQTNLQTGGYPLSRDQVARLVIARAIVTSPNLVIVDGLLDGLAQDTQDQIWETLANDDAPWTLVVVTNDKEIASRCKGEISVRQLQLSGSSTGDNTHDQ